MKSGYHRMKKKEQQQFTGPSTSYGTGGNIWKNIWNVKVPQKIKHFLW